MNQASPVGLRSITRFITTHNPFYLLSAALVLYGMTQTSTAGGSVTSGWLLLGLLGGYTILISLVGWAVVRFGQVWDDARTILLIVVLLLMSLSNCFDQVALKDPGPGAAFLTAGLCFSIGMCESLLRALRIRLALSFRAAMYSVFGLLFIHPIWLALLSVHGRNTAMIWGVYLFPWLVALLLLMFLPAANQGDERQPNGTPWRWPWYPWSVVAVLLVGLLLRSYSLSMAFEPTRGMAISWRPYFIVPNLLGVFALLLELARAAQHRRLEHVAIAAPMGLLFLSFPGTGNTPVDARFLQMLSTTAGSPVQITLAGLLAFYAVAWLRGLRAAEAGVLAAIGLLALVNSRTLDWQSLQSPSAALLEILAALQIGIGFWASRSWRVLVGVLLDVSALAIRGQDTWFTADHGFYPLHLALLLVLLVGFVFDDAAARSVRRIAWRVIPAAALAAAFGYDWLFPGVPAIVRLGYLAALTVFSGFGWYFAQAVGQLCAVLLTAFANVAAGMRQLYLLLANSELSEALPFYTWGMACLLVAALISFWKGGVLNRLLLWLREVNTALSARASPAIRSTGPFDDA